MEHSGGVDSTLVFGESLPKLYHFLEGLPCTPVGEPLRRDSDIGAKGFFINNIKELRRSSLALLPGTLLAGFHSG